MKDNLTLSCTSHASQRAAQWNLNMEAISYVIRHGQRFHRAGALIYYLRRQDIPAEDRSDDRWRRLAGTAVILAKNGCRVITVWRNGQSGLKRIKRKTKYQLSEEQLGWTS